MTDPILRKSALYFLLFLVGYLGMLFSAGYANYTVFSAIAIGGIVGLFGTPAWEQIKHE